MSWHRFRFRIQFGITTLMLNVEKERLLSFSFDSFSIFYTRS